MKRRLMLLITAMMMLMGMTFGSGIQAAAADPIYTNNILNVTVSSSDGYCNFRTGPGMAYGVITPIYNGTSLRVTGLSKNSSDGVTWGQTSYNGSSGWIALNETYCSDMETASTAVYDVTVTQQDNIYLRRGPGAEYDVISRPQNGQVLRIDRTMVNSFDGRPWGRTTYNGAQGWVSLNWTYRNSGKTYNQSQNVSFYNNKYTIKVTSSDGYVNFRSGPGRSYGVIQPIYNGAVLNITAALDNSAEDLVWGQTSYNGASGWVCLNETTVTSVSNASTAQYNVVVTDSYNICLRSGPGTEYKALQYNIKNGTTLYITQTIINSFDGRPWGKTRSNGIEGWVSLNWTSRS